MVDSLNHILLRENPTKSVVLEEFLHGTQYRLGIVDKLSLEGAEVHVKDFMIRHQRLLGLNPREIEVLQLLKQRDFEVYNHSNARNMR